MSWYHNFDQDERKFQEEREAELLLLDAKADQQKHKTNAIYCSERLESKERLETPSKADSLTSLRKTRKPIDPGDLFEDERRAVFRVARRLIKVFGLSTPPSHVLEAALAKEPIIASMDVVDFEGCYEEVVGLVKIPLGKGVLADAVREAKATVELPPCGSVYESEKYVFLLKLCWVLQKKAGIGRDFYLASQALAEEIGVSQRTISLRLKKMVRDKILVITKEKAIGRARRYQFVVK